MLNNTGLEEVLNYKAAFSKNRTIIFKSNSSAFLKYGHSVYGRFLVNNNRIKLPAEQMRVKIDAPRVNGYNSHLGGGLNVELYFTGVSLNEIDIADTFPEMK